MAAFRPFFGRLVVVSLLPLRIAPDRVHDHSAQHAIAAGDGRGERRQRTERVHEIGIAHAPYPRVHAAHGGTDDQAQVVHPEPFGQKKVLRADHVFVGIAREAHAEAIARLGGPAVADGVGQDDVVTVPVEELVLTEQHAAEVLRKEPAPRPSGPMKDENGVGDDPGGVPYRSPDGRVVEPELRQNFTTVEAKVANDEVAFDRSGI